MSDVMFSKFYKAEVEKGFIHTHYFKRVGIEYIDKNLAKFENNFSEKEIYLDIHFEEKAVTNFDFFLINNLKLESGENYLARWEDIDVSNIYYYILYDNKYCKDIATDKKGYLILKLKYIPDIKIITSYFKVNCRNTKWNNEEKVWHIPLFYIFEIAKLTLFLGGTISDTTLYHLCKLFDHFSSVNKIRSDETKINEKETKTNKTNWNIDNFLRESKDAFLNFLKNAKIFKFEHLIITNELKSDSFNIKIVPYKEETINKIKESNLFVWNASEQLWAIKKNKFPFFYTNIIKHFDFKICSYYDYFKSTKQKFKEADNNTSVKLVIGNKTNTNIKERKEKRTYNKEITDLIKANKKMKYHYSSSDSCASNEISNTVDSSYYEGRELVNTIKLVGAANSFYKEIIYNKLNKIKHLKPPNYTYDPKGVITNDGAGTKGIQVFDLPSDIYEWNRISFCIVPDETNNVDLYDPKILCSLVSDVYLLKEKALDLILKKYKKWPEYTDVFWNTICAENEFIICNKNFNTRQKLAHDRLFHKQYFYIFQLEQIKQSNYYNTLFLCKTLILLGEGKLVDDPLKAEYIIVHNSQDEEAIDFYNSFLKKKKKKMPLFVSPKYIYDCILNYCISYPSKEKKHFAFV